MTAANETMTREEWLTQAANMIADHCWRLDVGIKVTCSKPNSRSRRSVYVQRRESTGVWEVFIGAELSDSVRIVEVLLSAMVFAHLREHGLQCRERNVQRFSGYILDRCGAGASFTEWRIANFNGGPGRNHTVTSIVDGLGEYPHAALTLAEIQRDISYAGTTRSRQIKVTCTDPACRMILRASSTRLFQIGLPTCGCGAPMVSDELQAVTAYRTEAARTQVAEAVQHEAGSNAARTEQDTTDLIEAVTQIGADIGGSIAQNDRRQTDIRPGVEIDWTDEKIADVQSMQFFGVFEGSDLYVGTRTDGSALFVATIQTTGSMYTAEPSAQLASVRVYTSTQVERSTWQSQLWYAWNDAQAWRGGVYPRQGADVVEADEQGVTVRTLATGEEVTIKRSNRFRKLEIEDATEDEQAEAMVDAARPIQRRKRFEKLDFDE